MSRSYAVSSQLLDLARRLQRPALFAIVGLVNTGIDIGSYWALTRAAGVHPLAANAIAYSVGSLHGYVANGLITFRDRRLRLWSVRSLSRFSIGVFASLSVSTASMAVLILFFPDLVAKCASVLITFVINYLFSRAYVYATLETNIRARQP